MKETECKIKVNDVEVDRILRILGKPEFFTQRNMIYPLDEGFIRIRLEKGKKIITLKGRREEGIYNTRREIEFIVCADVDRLESFFSAMRLNKKLTYEKKRANFSFNDCVVSIDHLESGEIFIEIEGERKSIEESVRILGLADKELERRSYYEILMGDEDGLY